MILPTGLIKVLGYIISAALIIAVVLTAIHLLPGCMSAPKRDAYSCDECYTAMDCLYRIKDDKDKAACSQLIEACRDSLEETRTRARLEYCAKGRPERMTEAECRLLLNQK